jgi:hypothetical protein
LVGVVTGNDCGTIVAVDWVLYASFIVCDTGTCSGDCDGGPPTAVLGGIETLPPIVALFGPPPIGTSAPKSWWRSKFE